MSDRKGTIINGFEIGAVIGYGYFGCTYEARRTDTTEFNLALKMINIKQLDIQIMENLQHRNEVMKELNHKNIVEMISSFIYQEND